MIAINVSDTRTDRFQNAHSLYRATKLNFGSQERKGERCSRDAARLQRSGRGANRFVERSRREVYSADTIEVLLAIFCCDIGEELLVE